MAGGIFKMTILTKENLTDYMKAHMPELDYSKPLIISAVGEGTLEEDGDGFVNFVFRVSDGKKKLIVKQGRKEGRNVPMPLTEERNRLEYESLKIRKSIVPEYVPDVYFYDDVNKVFVMEDVSYLKIARFQMNRSVIFPKLPAQAAEYMAKTHFYTSEYYLEVEEFRKLTTHFMNDRMRRIFDTFAFISKKNAEDFGGDTDPNFIGFLQDVVFDPFIVKERYLMREAYMKKCEAFIHADFHTSNIFADQDEMKVIDMEYTFCGPIGYDAGYLASHFLSQYVCAAFRPFESAQKREDFRSYCLNGIAEMWEEYFRHFFACWDEDAKSYYKDIPGLKEDLQLRWLRDMIGFCANANLSRCSGDIGYPEYDDLPSEELRKHAVACSVLIDRTLFYKKDQYTSVAQCIDDIGNTADGYLRMLNLHL